MESRDTEGRLIYEIGGGQWNYPQIARVVGRYSAEAQLMRDFEVEQDYPGIGVKKYCCTRARSGRANGERMILLAIDDVAAKGTAKSG